MNAGSPCIFKLSLEVVALETLFLQWMRRAAVIAGVAVLTLPPLSKKPKVLGVFRASSSDGIVADHSSADFDAVADEMKRWKELPSSIVDSFIDEQGLLNEFALLWSLRNAFPLHFIIFKQTAVHIPHEANVEQVFSTAGLLSNALLDPGFLADLVMISRNKKVYKPEVKKLLSKYFQKYSKAGKLPFEEETLGLAEEEEE